MQNKRAKQSDRGIDNPPSTPPGIRLSNDYDICYNRYATSCVGGAFYMAYIVGLDRNQTRMITTSLDDLIDADNSVRVIDAYVESLNLQDLGFADYSGSNRSTENLLL